MRFRTQIPRRARRGGRHKPLIHVWAASAEKRTKISEPPEPKWFLLKALNYVVMAIFLGSMALHVVSTSYAPSLQRDATSLLPMLTVWSCCMARRGVSPRR